MDDVKFGRHFKRAVSKQTDSRETDIVRGMLGQGFDATPSHGLRFVHESSSQVVPATGRGKHEGACDVMVRCEGSEAEACGVGWCGVEGRRRGRRGGLWLGMVWFALVLCCVVMVYSASTPFRNSRIASCCQAQLLVRNSHTQISCPDQVLRARSTFAQHDSIASSFLG